MADWEDFIEQFQVFTDPVLSPELFKLWSGIALIAGACERRVWAKTGLSITYPNMYTLLVSPPGVGKGIIEDVRGLWADATEPGSKLRAFHVSPDSMTKASLMDAIGKAKQQRMLPTGPPLTYHSLLVPAEEFSVLLPAYDGEYLGTLYAMYGNREVYKEERRTSTVRELVIENPQLNILAGTQPAWLSDVFPDNAWDTGISRRMLMIYCSEGITRSVFYEPEIDPGFRAKLLRQLGQISQLYGQLKWTQSAASAFDKWAIKGTDGGEPFPTHSKLGHYMRSRSMHIIKLATVSAISRTGKLIIDLVDFERAKAWLLGAETHMPDIFRAMLGKSDREVIDELHIFVMQKFARNGKKPIQLAIIMEFLLIRMPQDKAFGLVQNCERANILARVAGTEDLYIPRPRYQFGAE